MWWRKVDAEVGERKGKIIECVISGVGSTCIIRFPIDPIGYNRRISAVSETVSLAPHPSNWPDTKMAAFLTFAGTIFNIPRCTLK